MIMDKITGDECIALFKEKFPGFIPYWNAHVAWWDDDITKIGLHSHMSSVTDYAIDLVNSNDQETTRLFFEFIEYLQDAGDEDVQTAICTSLLENLQNAGPEKVQFPTFVHLLGPQSIEYCKAWDTFTGVRTEGLWG